MADHNSSNFDAFCDDAYDETEENLILADAMEKGVTFEQAMSGYCLVCLLFSSVPNFWDLIT